MRRLVIIVVLLALSLQFSEAHAHQQRYAQAVRLGLTDPDRVYPIRPVLAKGVLVDATWGDQPNGNPLTFIEESYTPAEIAAAGEVTIAYMTTPTGAIAFVPYVPSAWPECLGAEHCILLEKVRWLQPGWKDSYDANRVLIDHEFAHVLSMRYETQLLPMESEAWFPINQAVNENCLADTVASVVLARGGFPPNELPGDYNVHYQCDAFWGADVVLRRQQALQLASDLLHWAATEGRS